MRKRFNAQEVAGKIVWKSPGRAPEAVAPVKNEVKESAHLVKREAQVESEPELPAALPLPAPEGLAAAC